MPRPEERAVDIENESQARHIEGPQQSVASKQHHRRRHLARQEQELAPQIEAAAQAEVGHGEDADLGLATGNHQQLTVAATACDGQGELPSIATFAVIAALTVIAAGQGFFDGAIACAENLDGTAGTGEEDPTGSHPSGADSLTTAVEAPTQLSAR